MSWAIACPRDTLTVKLMKSDAWGHQHPTLSCQFSVCSLHYATRNCSQTHRALRQTPQHKPAGREQLEQSAFVVFTQHKPLLLRRNVLGTLPPLLLVSWQPNTSHGWWQDVGLSKPLLGWFVASGATTRVATDPGWRCYRSDNRGKKCARGQRTVFLVAGPCTRLRLTECFQGWKGVRSSRSQQHLVSETAAFQPSSQAGQPEACRNRMAHPGSEATSTGAG